LPRAARREYDGVLLKSCRESRPLKKLFSARLAMKKVLVIAGVVILLLVVVALALPFLIDVNRFKPALETDLSTALGRKVEIGNIQLALLSGAVKVDNVSIADDPAFGGAPFLQAKQLAAGVALQPLIFSKKLEVSSFTITDPQVTLLRNPSGAWNFSSLGTGSKTKSGNTSNPSDFSVQKISIVNGTVTAGRMGPGGKTQTYQNVNVEVSDVSYTTQFPFHVTAKTPGNGSVKIDGKAGPVNQTDASLTPLETQVEVQNVDLASTGFVDSSSGLAGLISFNGSLGSDGKQMVSKGAIKAEKIKLVANGAPSGVPLNVDYDTDYSLKDETGNLKSGEVHIGKALAHLAGTFDNTGTIASIQMKLSGQGMPVADLEGALPAVGVMLPSGASLQSGILTVNLTVSGPADKLTINGPVNLSNAKLAGFNLKQKLGALSTFTGLGGPSGSDTDIQTLSANVHVDPKGTQAQDINLVVVGVGTVTGNANVSATQQLDGKMVAKVTPSGGAGGAAVSALSSLTGGGASSKSLTVPFTVKGTTSKPLFVPDVSGAVNNLVKGDLGNAGKNAGNASSAVSGVLGGFLKKKPSQ
jgi:AsmA protein